MDAHRLLSDELTHELLIRGSEVGSTVAEKRSLLRQELQRERTAQEVQYAQVYFEPGQELNTCATKLEELHGSIQDFDKDHAESERKRIRSRLLHVLGRLKRVTPEKHEHELRKTNLTTFCEGLLEALEDAYSIAILSDIRVEDGPEVAAASRSLLDEPNLLLPEIAGPTAVACGPRVEVLVDVPMASAPSPLSGGLSQPPGCGEGAAQRSLGCNGAPGSPGLPLRRDLRQPAAELCAVQRPMGDSRALALAERLSRMGTMLSRTRVSDRLHERRVSFPESEVPEGLNSSFRGFHDGSRIAQVESVNPSRVGESQRPFSTPYAGVTRHGASPGHDQFRGYYLPLARWNITFDGNSSVTSFLEDLEDLADSRGMPKTLLFQSISECLKGDALLWFRPRKHLFADWDDFKAKIRQAFLPPDYEANLMEDIRRRTQGPEERLVNYVSRMQSLFGKLSNPPPEREQLHMIRRNLLPYIHTSLALLEIDTIDHLLRVGQVVEESHWRARQYCPPPSNPRGIQEPELACRRPVSGQRPVGVKAIHVDEVGQDPARHSDVDAVHPAREATSNPRRCYNCGTPGHMRAACPQPRKVVCYRCGSAGYIASNCPNCSGNLAARH